jgi:hypothetical protein
MVFNGCLRVGWVCVFCVVVVAEKPLYTTTTNGLREVLYFGISQRFGLLAGCGDFRKQFGLARRITARSTALG